MAEKVNKIDKEYKELVEKANELQSQRAQLNEQLAKVTELLVRCMGAIEVLDKLKKDD